MFALPGLVAALYVAAFIMTIVHAGWGKVPLWVPVLLVIIGLLLQTIPR
jgi:hypothetical protein